MTDKLDKEERDILESFEKGEWKSVPDLEGRKLISKIMLVPQCEKTKELTFEFPGETSKNCNARRFRKDYPIKHLFPVLFINLLMAILANVHLIK